MNLKEIQKNIDRMRKEHRVKRIASLTIGIWFICLDFIPDNFTYLNWLRHNPDTFFLVLGVYLCCWSSENWKTTPELNLLTKAAELGKSNLDL